MLLPSVFLWRIVSRLKVVLARSEDQVAARKELAANPGKNSSARIQIEVDQYIAAQDEVEIAQGSHTLAQIEDRKAHHLPYVVLQLPFQARALKILDQQGRRAGRGSSQSKVSCGPGLLQDRVGEIRAGDLNVPIRQTEFEQQHRNAIALLPR